MSKLSSILYLATIFLLFTFFTCNKLPTDPLKDPENLKIGLFIKDNTTTIIQQNDSVTIGVIANIPSLVRSLNIIYGENLKDTFLFFKDPFSNTPDTVYFRTIYTTIGKKTITVKVVRSDNSPKEFPFDISVLPEKMKITFDSKPSKDTTVFVGQSARFRIVSHTAPSSTVKYSIKATTAIDSTDSLSISGNDSASILFKPSKVGSYSLNVVAYNETVRDSSIKINVRVIPVPPIGVVSSNSVINSNVSDTLTFTGASTDSLALLYTELYKAGEVAILPTSKKDSLKILFTPKDVKTYSFAINIKGITTDGKNYNGIITIERIATGASTSIWNQDTLTMNVPEGSSIDKSLNSLLKDSTLSGVTFSSDKGVINQKIWHYPIPWGADTIDTATLSANYNDVVYKLKITLNITSADSTDPKITLTNPSSIDTKVSAPAVTCNFTIADTVSGVSKVVFKVGSTILTDTLHSGNSYQCIVKDLVKGSKTTLTVEAYDSSMKKNKSSMDVSLTYDPDMADNVNPKMSMKSPLTPVFLVFSPDTVIQIICTDESGIASVTAKKGTTLLTVKNTDSIYSAAISGLTAGKTDTITFEATDGSSAANKAQLYVYVKYDQTITDKTGPVIVLKTPVADSTKVSSKSISAIVTCTDSSGVASVTCKMGTTDIPVTKSTGDIYTATVSSLVTGANTIIFTATDKASTPNVSNKTVTVIYDSTMGDKTGPAIVLKTPAADSTKVSSKSISVDVTCTDSSGVASVTCKIGTTDLPVTKGTGDIYTATVTSLISGANTFIFTATDKASTPNVSNKTVTVIYDSTMGDSIGPTIIQKNGITSGAVISDSIIMITDSIADPSGLDSVYWTLNNVWAGKLAAVSGQPNSFRLCDTLKTHHTNSIIIYAIDKATKHNRDSAVIILDYNLPPVINDTAVAIDRNTAKTWTLGVQSADTDSLFWSRLTSLSPLSGSITGTLPSITFTPATNWSGKDSFYVRVSDGYWSDTAKVKITVVDIPVAPSIVTQPQSQTRTVGQSVTFSVSINADVNPEPTFQWKKNGVAIASANLSTYTIGSIAITDSGTYTVTVTNGAGTVTSTPSLLTVNYAPTIITQPLSQILYLGKSTTISVVATGNPAPTYVWRKNGTIITGATSSSYTISSPGVSDSGKYYVSVTNSLGGVYSDTAELYAGVNSVSAGNNHSLFLKTDGTLWACGDNSSGQLCDGTGLSCSIPKQVMTNVQTAVAGYNFSLIVKTDGTLWISGSNGSNEPVMIMTYVQCIATYAGGGGHILILQTDGTLWAFGNNSDGQLGNSTTVESPNPVEIMSGVQYIAAGYNFSLAVKTDGSLWGWGANELGQLGDSTATTHLKPVKNTKITGMVQSIAAGYDFSLILMKDGSLLGCGSNSLSQLGLGNTISNTIIPQTIMTGVKSMSAGGSTHILLNDGSLWGIGTNSQGQLGKSDPNGIYKFPVKIIPDGVLTVSSGPYHSAIISTDRKVSTTGWNGNGQLGNGDSGGGNQYGFIQISF